MKRIIDILLACVLLVVLSVPMIIIIIIIRLTSNGPAFHWSDRVGRNNIIFKMPKFRTMSINTPSLPTHLMTNPDDYLTSVGGFLRKTSLDEFPQLFSILKGDMSFVGPRPALFNQTELIALRQNKEIDKLLPGLTGWAQVNGRDELSIKDKVSLDEIYLINKSFFFDLRILWLTLYRVLAAKDVSH
jgi:O-antigen biosynthesis protein WbqP